MNGEADRSEQIELSRQHDLAMLRLDPPDDMRLQQAALDRLATLARQLFATQASAVTIVGKHRVWFVGTAGVAPGNRRREHTLCDRVVCEDGLRVIADAGLDPEVSASPAVVHDRVRFYAGAPIHSHEGARIGTVCVWDDHPRTGAEALDFTALQDLAALAADTIELRRPDRPAAVRDTQRQLQASEALLQSLELCCVLFDRKLRIVLASPAFCALIGRPARSLLGLSLAGLLEEPLDQQQLQQIEHDQLHEHAVWQLRTYGHRVQTMDCEISPARGDRTLFLARLRHPQRQALTRQPGPHVVRILGQLRHARDPVEILRDVLKMAVQELDGCKAIISVRNGPGRRILLGQPGAEEFCDALERHHRFEPGFSICATTCESGQSTISADTRLEDRWPNYGWLDLAYGIRAVWSTPIHSAGRRPDAALTLFRDVAGEPSTAQMAVLREAAGLAALAVEKLDLGALSREIGNRTWTVARFLAMFPHLAARIDGDGALVAHAVVLSDEQVHSGLDLSWAERTIRQVTGDAAVLVAPSDRQIIAVTRAAGDGGIDRQRAELRRRLGIDAVARGRSRRLQSVVVSLPVIETGEATALLARLSDALAAQARHS